MAMAKILGKEAALEQEELDRWTKKTEQWEIAHLQKRSPKAEYEAALVKGNPDFYAGGSFLHGYFMPGLTQHEVNEFRAIGWSFTNRFSSDPARPYRTKAYWQEVHRFASRYNRLVYLHMAGSYLEERLESYELAPWGPEA